MRGLALAVEQSLPVLVSELAELTAVEGTEDLIVGLLREALAFSGLDDGQAAILLRFATLITQHFEDVPGQAVLDFSMPRYRLRDPGARITVPIVLSPVANQYPAEPLDRLDQLGAFHATSNSPTFRIPGISPLVMS